MVQAEQVARLSPDSEVERQAGDGQPTLFPSSARSPPAPPLEPRGAKGAAVPHQPLVADSHGNASLQTNDETNAAGPLMVHPRPRKNTWGSLDSRAEVGPGFHSTPPSRWAAHLTNSPSSMSPSADSYSHSHSHSHNSPAAHARHLSASSAGDSSGFSALGGSARPGHSRARSGGTDFDFFGPSSLTSGTTDATSFFPGSPTKSSHGPTSPASPWSHVSGSRGSGSGSGSGSRSGARGQSASPEAEREQAPRLDLGEPYALPFPSDGPLFGEQPDLHLGPRTDGEQSWNQNPLGLQIGTGLGGANTPAEMGPSQRARADEEPAEELHELEGNADEPVHEVDTNAGEGAEGVTSSGARLPSGHNQPENVADTDAGSARPYSGPSGQRSRPRPRNGILRAAAAALPGRLAKRVQSPKNAPDPSASTQPLHGDTSPSRRPVRRSESAPNLAWARAQESHRTNPYDQRETRRATASRPSSRPTTADSTSTSGSFSRLPLLASLRARSRQRRSPFSTTISSFTPAASSRSSPANSRTTSLINVSAPGQAPQRPGLGLYNCGYHSQGAATPNRSGRPKRKSHTRHLSLRSLSDMLLRDSGPESGTNATSSAEFHPSSLALDDGRDEEGGSSGRTREANLQPESKGKGRAQDLLPAAALTDGPSLAMNQRPAPTAGRQPSTPLRPTLLRTAYSTPITSPVPAVAVGHGSSSPAAPPPPSPTDLFDTLLPRELRIHVLGCLVNAHVHEHEEDVERGTWCGKIARETRFVGIEAAVRELARLSRVSRTWQSLVLDGQLWRTLDVSPYQEISHDALLRLARAAGPFVKKLNLRGMANLPSSMLVGLTAAHSGSGISEHVENGHGTGAIGAIGAMTRLTHLDLEGCRSISNKALHHLLSRSPALRSVNLRDLRCVNNETCALLARSAFKLEAVDVSRCVHMDANGLLALTGASTVTDDADEAGKQAPTYPYRTPLKVLRASGIRGTSPEMMATLGRKVPHLEVLDMSYSPDLTDDALAAFIASPGPDDPECGPYISLSSRQAGLDPSSDTTYHRRLTTLVHLNLSACRHLTDRSCAHFAHAVPQLEVLELANIGPALRDAGLVKLFATTPEIRKVDLEEASELTEATFAALTPPEAYVEAYVQLPAPDAPSPSHSLSRRFRRAASPTPTIALRAATGSAKAKPLPPVAGLQLTHLIVSHVTRVDERTMLSLLRACPHLRIFEADDTHAGDKIAREFVRLARFRELRNASLSLVDCRGLARNIATSLAAEKVTRPRNGVRGYAFAQFDYDDPDEELGSHASHAHAERAGTAATLDECDDARVALKSFWGWQTVDARAKAKAKAAKKARGARRHFTNGLSGGAGGSTTTASANGGSGGGASTGAGLGNGRNWIERGATHGRATPHRSARWGRALAGGLLSPLDDDDDDPRGCVIA